MNRKITIGIDLMGNDHPAETLLQELVHLSSSIPPNIQIVMIGKQNLFSPHFPFPFYEAEDVIEMDENPLLALRRKKNSSQSVGLRLLKKGTIDGLISAGNTGALVTSAKMIVGTFSNLLRPALLAFVPTKKKPLAVLDVGANLQVKTIHLFQFALLGAAFQMARDIQNPKIGLLNIGSEPIKGTLDLREAYKKLKGLSQKHHSFQFSGNIEGKSVFDGDIDVLIADGFTGNIFLKTAEGIASLILDQMQTRLNERTKEMQQWRSHLHYSEYPGAVLAGIKGIVIKCHGYGSADNLIKAVLYAASLIEKNFLSHFKTHFDREKYCFEFDCL